MKKRTYLLWLGLLSVVIINAQSITPSIVNSMGGSTTVNGMIYEWSFAEMTLVNTVASPNLIITQGVLQCNNDSIISGVTEETSLSDIVVFPNPVEDKIYIQSGCAKGNTSYLITDITGKTVVAKTNLSGENKTELVDFSKFSPGTYVLTIIRIQQEQSYTQSFKILKTN